MFPCQCSHIVCKKKTTDDADRCLNHFTPTSSADGAVKDVAAH